MVHVEAGCVNVCVRACVCVCVSECVCVYVCSIFGQMYERVNSLLIYCKTKK